MTPPLRASPQLTDELARSLKPAFARYARWYAGLWGIDHEELEGEMWLALTIHGGSARTRDGQPLLSQRPAFIAKRMALRVGDGTPLRYQARGARARTVSLDTLPEWRQPTTPAPSLTLDLRPYLAQVNPKQRAASRAALRYLVAGYSVREIDAARIAPRRIARRARRDLIHLLKESA